MIEGKRMKDTEAEIVAIISTSSTSWPHYKDNVPNCDK